MYGGPLKYLKKLKIHFGRHKPRRARGPFNVREIENVLYKRDVVYMETADLPPPFALSVAPRRIPKKISARSVIYIRGTGTFVRLAGKINCHSGRTINEPPSTLSLIPSLPFLPREANRDIRGVSFGGSFPRAKRRRRISPLHQASSSGAYQTSEGGFVISRPARPVPHRSSTEPIPPAGN